MTHRLLLTLALAALALSACGPQPQQGAQVRLLCDGGDLIEADAGDFCVYTAPITETRFICPPELPILHEFPGGVTICASEALSGGQLEDELIDRGYLEPRPEPDLIEPDMVDPDLGEPDMVDPDLVEPEPCQDGEQARCNCPDGSYGAQTCAAGQWGECSCREEWTAPEVHEAQAPPLGCDEPSLALALPADLDNEEVFDGPCLTEIFERACPVLWDSYDYDRAEVVRHERGILNPALYAETLYAIYYNYGPLLETWELNAQGEPTLWRQDDGNDGSVEMETRWTYDGDARVLSQTSTGPGYSSTSSWTYDAAGRIVRQESRAVFSDQETRYVTTNEYREDGEPLRQEITKDGERVAAGVWTYDAEHPERLLRSDVTTLDRQRLDRRQTWREDGTLESALERHYSTGIEENGREFSYLSELINISYDERGNELRRTIDPGGNGIVIQLQEQTWDAQDRLLTSAYGPLAGPPERFARYTYGELGLESVEHHVARQGRDHITTTTYDPALNKPLEAVTREQFTDALVSRVIYAWHANGEALLQETDSDGDGEVNSRTRWIRDRAGNLLDLQVDHNADGFLEERTASRYQCR